MTELRMIWDEVVSMLELDLNNIQLKNWILPLEPIMLKDQTLILDAKSTFIRKMAKKQYLEKIKECVSYICQDQIEIILIDPSQENYFFLMDQSESPSNKESSLEKSYVQNSFLNEIENKKNTQEKERLFNGYKSLNPKYTMENFVRGKSNEFALATAKAVVTNPGGMYNPLFIYGTSGLGKTHLMQAIAHAILEKKEGKKVLYITSEKFMNEMIAMIENGSNTEKEKFRSKYRSIDVLLIDDIQFIAGKKATMEEIFHTFNDLKEANKQIVLSSDKPPKELKNLEDRLVTRFEGGMTVDIQKPDFETRVAILSHKMKGESMELPSYILEFIANNVTANIRELEGALLKVIAFFKLKNSNPFEKTKDENMIIARNALKLEEAREVQITVEDIMETTSRFYNLESNDLYSKSRQASIVLPRQTAMYLARKLTNQSLVAIGRSFNRDHTTVMHAIDKIEALIKSDQELVEEVEQITSQLKSK